MSLGQRIRHLRQSRGLTQSQLGGAELSKSFISLLEKDRTRPSIDTLQLIARRLGTSVDSLLGQDGHLPEMVCEGLLALSDEAIRGRNFDRASKLLETATFLAASYGVDEALREAQMQAAHIEIEQRQFSEAWSRLADIGPACERAKDQWRHGRALLLMGRLKLRQRDFAQAVPLLEKSLLVLRRARAGRDRARVEALIALGTTYFYLGKWQAAMRRYEEAVNSEVAAQNPVLRGRAFWGVGLTQRKLRNYAVAKQYLVSAKDALESAEELPDLILVLKNLGQLFYEQGQAQEALRYLHQSLRVMERLQRQVDHASTLTEIGRVHLSMGSLEEAAHFAGQALEEAKAVSDPMEVAEASMVLARVGIEQKDKARAIALLKDALAIFQERKMRAKAAEAARELGLLLRERGAHAQAAEYLALSIDQGKAPAEGEPEAVPVADG